MPKRITKVQLACLRDRFREPAANRFHPKTAKNATLLPCYWPLHEALADVDKVQRSDVITAIFKHMLNTKSSAAGWVPADWGMCFRTFESDRKSSFAQAFVLAAYRSCNLLIVDEVFKATQKIHTTRLAEHVFGSGVVLENMNLIREKLLAMGYGAEGVVKEVGPAVAEMMLILGEANVRKWRDPLRKVKSGARYARFASRLHAISIALVGLDVIQDPYRFRAAFGFAPHKKINPHAGIDPEWLRWTEVWTKHSAVEPSTRKRIVATMRSVGRWLKREHPKVTSPAQWDARLAAELVAAVSKWKVGDYLDVLTENVKRRAGEELAPNSKRGFLSAVRTVFMNLQELELIPVRFNPITAIKIPKSISSQIDYAPRVLADDIWAKLLYAGINLKPEHIHRYFSYPIELARAVTINWLFDGIRNDELHRLEVGCVEREPQVIDLTKGEVKPSICYLRVPANKYKGSFRKPVDPIVADAVEAWERVRPEQPMMLDRRTRRLTHRLFAFRGKPVGRTIINQRIIPLLCRLAGVPRADAVGNITSHRARSTIASQLYNADRPLGLLELMEWLGHKKVESVLAYAKTDKKKLANAYAQADYFKRNVGRITVLLDREVIESGEAAKGKPYKNYDLGHGYCRYNFFSECIHRMACVRCSFYLPKGTAAADLLEARCANDKLIEEVPLREEEVKAAEGDARAIAELVESLGVLPAPDGSTPRRRFHAGAEVSLERQ